MGLIKFILIFLVVYYAFKFVARLVLPFLVQYLFKKTQQNMQDQFGGPQPPLKKEEGEITIHPPKKGSQKDNSKGDSGEFVDFEEVE